MHFYDDKRSILENLNRFYSKNAIWIPNNLKLCLFQQKAQENEVPIPFGNIQVISGKGFINDKYHTQLKLLAERFKWTSIPESFSRFTKDFQAIFGVTTISEKSPSIQKVCVKEQDSKKKDTIVSQSQRAIKLPEFFYSSEKSTFVQQVFENIQNPEKKVSIESCYQHAIQLPALFYSDEDKTCFQSFASKQAKMVYDQLLAFEMNLWVQYHEIEDLDQETLEIYDLCIRLCKLENTLLDHSNNAPIYVKIEKIKSTDSAMKKIKTALKTKYKLTKDDIIECKEEAIMYYLDLNTHLQRVAYQEAYYNQFIKHLCENISAIPVQKIELIKPLAFKASPGISFDDIHTNGTSTLDTKVGEYSLFGTNSREIFTIDTKENDSSIIYH